MEPAARDSQPVALFTRHMRGAIEADRDRRLGHAARARTPWRTPVHPRLAAAIAANRRGAAQPGGAGEEDGDARHIDGTLNRSGRAS